MSNRKTLDERIAAAKAEAAQKEARVKELLQQQKAQERKDRNHRLCKRGGQLEKLLPELPRLTEEQFEIFVKKCLLTPHTKGILAELAPPEPEHKNDGSDSMMNGEGAVTETAVTEARTNTQPAQKAPATAHNISANNKQRPVQAVTQHGSNANVKPADAPRVAS